MLTNSQDKKTDGPDKLITCSFASERCFVASKYADIVYIISQAIH
jgi:hypothetical protein